MTQKGNIDIAFTIFLRGFSLYFGFLPWMKFAFEHVSCYELADAFAFIVLFHIQAVATF